MSKMSLEEARVKMHLLDCTPEQQEFYRANMQALLDDFTETYNSFEPEFQDLWLAALSIAMMKFSDSIGGE